jgi:hypothetical protein
MNIQAVVLSGGPPACKPLGLWLSRHCPDWRYGSGEYGYNVARNQSITRFLREDVPKGKTHLLMLDHDMVPLPDQTTDAILTEPGDMLYCGFVGRAASHGHKGQGDFGFACCRLSAGLLEKVGYPWSRDRVDGGRRTQCECAFFRWRAATIGESPRMVGIVGHEQTCILLPTDTELGWAVAWPRDLQ